MPTEDRIMEAAKVRLRLQMNNRLRLECMAAVSRLFREFGEPIEDEVLASLVFALPEELLGESTQQLSFQEHNFTAKSGQPIGPPKPGPQPVGPPKPGPQPVGPPKPGQPVGPPGQPIGPPKPPGQPIGPPRQSAKAKPARAH